MGSPCKTIQRCRPSAWCLSWQQPALQQTCLWICHKALQWISGFAGHPWICSSSTSISPGAELRSRQRPSWSRIHFCQNRPQGKPHSYRYGYDTGVGYNRQFKYEERDNYGVLHGRYGFYDQAGKLQIVNYHADPHKGFYAEGEHVPTPEYKRRR